VKRNKIDRHIQTENSLNAISFEKHYYRRKKSGKTGRPGNMQGTDPERAACGRTHYWNTRTPRYPKQKLDHGPGRHKTVGWAEQPYQQIRRLIKIVFEVGVLDRHDSGFYIISAGDFLHPARQAVSITGATHHVEKNLFVRYVAQFLS